MFGVLLAAPLAVLSPKSDCEKFRELVDTPAVACQSPDVSVAEDQCLSSLIDSIKVLEGALGNADKMEKAGMDSESIAKGHRQAGDNLRRSDPRHARDAYSDAVREAARAEREYTSCLDFAGRALKSYDAYDSDRVQYRGARCRSKEPFPELSKHSAVGQTYKKNCGEGLSEARYVRKSAQDGIGEIDSLPPEDDRETH